MRTNWMDTKATEPFEHRAIEALKRRLKYGPRMTKEERAEFVRQLKKQR